MYCLKESAQNIWSEDLVHEKTFWLSSRTSQIPFNILSRTNNLSLKILVVFNDFSSFELND